MENNQKQKTQGKFKMKILCTYELKKMQDRNLLNQKNVILSGLY